MNSFPQIGYTMSMTSMAYVCTIGLKRYHTLWFITLCFDSTVSGLSYHGSPAFRSLKAINGTALPTAKLFRPHPPARALRSTTSAGCLVPPSLLSYLILPITVQQGEWVHFEIAWHLCYDYEIYALRYIVVSLSSLSSDKCTYCKALESESVC